jgi:hypothetical protein
MNPRQGSLFRTNRIGLAGSGKYIYVTKSKCPWSMPRVRLISYVKCCQSLSKVTASINDAMKTHDVVVVTGDEYCGVTDTRPHFRQYYGTSVVSKADRLATIPAWTGDKAMMDGNGTAFPLFIPLGPREEFDKVDQSTVRPSEHRKYLYNFLGSMTSYSRRILKRVLTDELAKPVLAIKYPGFVHITDKWHIKVNAQNGYVTPERCANLPPCPGTDAALRADIGSSCWTRCSRCARRATTPRRIASTKPSRRAPFRSWRWTGGTTATNAKRRSSPSATPGRPSST